MYVVANEKEEYKNEHEPHQNMAAVGSTVGPWYSQEIGSKSPPRKCQKMW